MHKLQPKFPEVVLSASLGDASTGGLCVKQIGSLATLRLQGDWGSGGLSSRTKEILGINWPEPQRYEKVGDRVLSWAGPNEWALLCNLADEDRLLTELRNASLDEFASILSMSDSRIGFHVSGRWADALIAKGCALDLQSGTLAGQSTSITRFAGITAMLFRVADGWQLYFDTSFRAYIRSWLVDAGSEWLSE